MTTIEIFKRMLDWLFANTDAKNQSEVARAAGLNETTVSRIIKGRVKSVKQETLRAVNTAYGNVFNPDWLRGESDVMLVADLAQEGLGVGTGLHKNTNSPTPPDYAAQLIAAKDEMIAALRQQLHQQQADKDETIAALKHELEAHRTLVKTLQQQVADLRLQAIYEQKGLSPGHSPLEPVEQGTRKRSSI